jgi:hypothetical protein
MVNLAITTLPLVHLVVCTDVNQPEFIVAGSSNQDLGYKR